VTHTALDLNADRIWALSGSGGQGPRVDRIEGEHSELPLVLSLEGRNVEVGHAGTRLVRKSPHQVCAGFLPRLGQNCEWHHGRHRLGPNGALKHVFARLAEALPNRLAMAIALPAYLANAQVNLLVQTAREAGLPILGALPRNLAAGLASYADHPWHDLGIVVDVDDHALTLGIFRPNDADLCTMGQKALPQLGLKAWRERLMAAIADRCIRTSRRDPRECPDADQMVYEQLDRVFEACSQNRPASLEVQGSQWFQTVVLTPAEAAAATMALARHTAEEIHAALAWAEQQLTSASIYFTAGVGRLPGLAAAVYQRCENKAAVAVLPASAAALAAYELCRRIHKGDLAAGYFGSAAPLPDRGETPYTLPFPDAWRSAVE
jgi:molecular chaperone DnaK (HSP70)